MRKVFSYFVLALCLIVSTQVKAETLYVGSGQTYETLKAALDAAVDGDVIQLQTAVQFGSDSPYELSKGGTITVDLNSFTVTDAPRVNIFEGKLIIKSSVKDGNNTWSSDSKGNACLCVRGSTNKDTEFQAGLVIDENVTVSSSNAGYGAFITTNDCCAYGATLEVYGTIDVSAAGIGLYVNGSVNKYEGDNIAKVIVGQKAAIYANNDADWVTDDGELKAVKAAGFEEYKNTQSGIYAAGYAKWTLQGTISGGNGVYIKGGIVNIDGATIVATAEEYWAPIKYGNGAIAVGSALIIDNNNSYSGNVEVKIEGDASISSDNGYAIEEVTTQGGSTTIAVNVTSGNISGSDKGCIATTETLKDKIINNATITGGTFNGTEIADYLPATSGVVTPVVNKNNETVYVIDVMPQEAQEEGWLDDINSASAASYVKYEGAAIADITLTKTETECAYLTITSAQKLIIADGQTLNAGEIVLGENASIEVEAGGKLIVNGVNGLVAFQPENLVIKADAENGMGTFVLNPAVVANKTPYATVEYITSTDCGKETTLGVTEYHWELISSPFAEISTIYAETASFFEHIVNGAFVQCPKADIISNTRAFDIIALCPNANQAASKYTFTGKLQGATSLDKYAMKRGFNYMGNAYMGEINAKEMVQELQQNASGVRSLIYTWNVEMMNWTPSNAYDLDDLDKLNPMAPIVLYSDAECEANLSYEELIWNTNK